MGLIINKKIDQLRVGYPTVSDKYDVTGAVLDGATAVKFGDLVNFSDTNGYYTAIAPGTVADGTTAKIAGFVLATNVQLATIFPDGGIDVQPGTAFNLLLNGNIAVKLAATAVKGDIKNGAKVYVTNNGVITTKTDGAAIQATGAAKPLPGMTFTGIYEEHGADKIAEIAVCACK